MLSMVRAFPPQPRAASGTFGCRKTLMNAHNRTFIHHKSSFTARAASDSSSSSSKVDASYGIFVMSASPVCAEAVAVSGVDWLCLDAQHGAVRDAYLAQLPISCSGSGSAVRFKCTMPALLRCRNQITDYFRGDNATAADCLCSGSSSSRC